MITRFEVEAGLSATRPAILARVPTPVVPLCALDNATVTSGFEADDRAEQERRAAVMALPAAGLLHHATLVPKTPTGGPSSRAETRPTAFGKSSSSAVSSFDRRRSRASRSLATMTACEKNSLGSWTSSGR